MEDEGIIFEEMGAKMARDHLGKCSVLVSLTTLEVLRGQGVQLTCFPCISGAAVPVVQ